MKSTTRYLFLLAPVVGLISPGAHGATIWNGPVITYNQPGTDPTLAANQDPLTSRVVFTRAAFNGLFNAVAESQYVLDFSPADTEWAPGELADYATLTYVDWKAASGGQPFYNLPGLQLVCHLKTDDVYLSIRFTYWGDRGAGGFTYERSTPSVANPPLIVTSAVVGNSLDITWPSPGPRLQTQANSSGVGLGTNWVDVVGSSATNHVIVPIDRSQGSVFYRLSMP